MRVCTNEERARDPLRRTILSNGGADRDDMRLVKCPVKGRTTVPRRAKNDALGGIYGIRNHLGIRREQRFDVDEIFGPRWSTCSFVHGSSLPAPPCNRT